MKQELNTLDGHPYYRPLDAVLLLFIVRKWTVAKIAKKYRIDSERIFRRLAKYGDVPLEVATHAEEMLRDRCTTRMEGAAREIAGRAKSGIPKDVTLGDIRTVLRAWTRDVLARVPVPIPVRPS